MEQKVDAQPSMTPRTIHALGTQSRMRRLRWTTFVLVVLAYALSFFHRMAPAIEEILYPAMEDYELDIVIGQGPSARSVKVPLQRFTLIGATTRAGLLTSPLRGRFGIVHRLDFYEVADIEEIVHRSASILAVSIDGDSRRLGQNDFLRSVTGQLPGGCFQIIHPGDKLSLGSIDFEVGNMFEPLCHLRPKFKHQVVGTRHPDKPLNIHGYRSALRQRLKKGQIHLARVQRRQHDHFGLPIRQVG